MYGGVDKLDQMLEEWNLRYITWRWWHAPMQHGKAIAHTQAWQIYKDCASGCVREEWKVDKPMSCPMFRQRLAEQQTKYTCLDNKYPGDDTFHEFKR